MSKPSICHDVIKVVYPLYTKKGNIFSGLYTCACYDLYIYNKRKYVRGEPMFFAEDLTNKSKVYKHISECPKTIEEGPEFTGAWKYKYNGTVGIIENDNIDNYVTHLWLSGK